LLKTRYEVRSDLEEWMKSRPDWQVLSTYWRSLFLDFPWIPTPAAYYGADGPTLAWLLPTLVLEIEAVPDGSVAWGARDSVTAVDEHGRVSPGAYGAELVSWLYKVGRASFQHSGSLLFAHLRESLGDEAKMAEVMTLFREEFRVFRSFSSGPGGCPFSRFALGAVFDAFSFNSADKFTEPAIAVLESAFQAATQPLAEGEVRQIRVEIQAAGLRLRPCVSEEAAKGIR
jgi:hypothetical protein